MRARGARRYRRRMADFVRAAATADIGEGQGRLWRHGDKRIALFRTPAGVYAADNRCPHQGYALKDGDIREDVLTCAWHNWKFRLTDGKCLFGGENIRTYPVIANGCIPSWGAKVLTIVSTTNAFTMAPRVGGASLPELFHDRGQKWPNSAQNWPRS
jgi:nitrite reductase/ring-hydroxylating ferredoxin subunit